MCFVWISEQTPIISLYNINWLVFITKIQCLLRGTNWVFKSNSVTLRYKTFSHRPFQCKISPLAIHPLAASFSPSICPMFQSNATYLPSCPRTFLSLTAHSQPLHISHVVQNTPRCAAHSYPPYILIQHETNIVRAVLCLFIGNGDKRQNDYVVVGTKGGNNIQFNNSLYLLTSRTNICQY